MQEAEVYGGRWEKVGYRKAPASKNAPPHFIPTNSLFQTDQFIVSGGSPVPAICGVNSGTHMYIDMGLSTNSPVVLTVVTSGASFARSFSVKVTQIECSSLAKGENLCRLPFYLETFLK